eukprot:TRINITY_DN7735_c1_g1_i1.p1 TRINITY_DN7735_c1_g1~~TRINITY_DN7735_c1_g1_i1.p1  ORF type:complete len:268 (+),score=49.77 TRINITY_DN7735_c1_g1_i1:74-877(+)
METLMMIEAASYLSMKDVASWRAIDLATKQAFDTEGDENVWLCCVLNGFGTDVFFTYELYERPHRKLCFKFFSMLSHVTCMASSTTLLVEDLEEASLIERRMRSAVTACSAHRAGSGQDAQALVGDFFVHDEFAGTMFRFGDEGKPTIAGLPPGVLMVGLLWDGGALQVRAWYGVEHNDVFEEYPQAARVQLTMNVDSAETDTFLSYHGTPLILDGQWRSSSCGCYRKRFACDSDLAVLCVLSLLVGDPTNLRPSLVNALNLETYTQ